jgi:hypothetical protein
MQNAVFNGRAFFRSRSQQRYVFIASYSAEILASATKDCQFAMTVGGLTIFSGPVITVDPARVEQFGARGHVKQTSNVRQGTASLAPGYYPVEFVVGCLQVSSRPPALQVSFSVRPEYEAQPRAFEADELIHIQR